MLCSIDDEPSAANYAVGCVDVMAAPAHTALAEGGAAGGGQSLSRERHGLFARVYYPANAGAAGPLVKWIPRDEYLMGAAAYAGLHGARAWCAKQAMGHMLRLSACRTAAVWAPPLADAARPFPVVVFSHGLASCRLYHSAVSCRLARRGYIVMAVEHSDRSAAWTYRIDHNGAERPIAMTLLDNNEEDYALRNRQVHRRAMDCLGALQALEQINAKGDLGHKLVLGAEFDWAQFRGRLDLSRPMVAGHSFGGATALSALAMGSGFHSAVALDTWMYPCDRDLHDKLASAHDAAVLFVNSELWQWRENRAKIAKILSACPGTSRAVTISGSGHLNYCDWSHAVRWRWLAQRLRFGGPVEPAACDRLCSALVHGVYERGVQLRTAADEKGGRRENDTLVGDGLDEEDVRLVLADDATLMCDLSEESSGGNAK